MHKNLFVIPLFFLFGSNEKQEKFRIIKWGRENQTEIRWDEQMGLNYLVEGLRAETARPGSGEAGLHSKSSEQEPCLTQYKFLHDETANDSLYFLRRSSVKTETIQIRLAWLLRKNETHKSRSENTKPQRPSSMARSFQNFV